METDVLQAEPLRVAAGASHGSTRDIDGVNTRGGPSTSRTDCHQAGSGSDIDDLPRRSGPKLSLGDRNALQRDALRFKDARFDNEAKIANLHSSASSEREETETLTLQGSSLAEAGSESHGDRVTAQGVGRPPHSSAERPIEDGSSSSRHILGHGSAYSSHHPGATGDLPRPIPVSHQSSSRIDVLSPLWPLEVVSDGMYCQEDE
jgi:hypothetical protein